jgi:hypothetical protein
MDKGNLPFSKPPILRDFAVISIFYRNPQYDQTCISRRIYHIGKTGCEKSNKDM